MTPITKDQDKQTALQALKRLSQLVLTEAPAESQFLDACVRHGRYFCRILCKHNEYFTHAMLEDLLADAASKIWYNPNTLELALSPEGWHLSYTALCPGRTVWVWMRPIG